jgi:outer membrane protein assembly factor BamE (lipoprotein component of BamABCDE complex)
MNFLLSADPWVIVAVLTVMLLAAYGVFARWCFYGPAVPRDKLNQLVVGATMEEVRRLLGPPRLLRPLPDGVREWVYGAPMKRHVLMLQFSADGKLQSFAHAVPGGHVSSATLHNR